MTHLTPDLIERLDTSAVDHLENCRDCRYLIVTDVDLGATKAHLMDRVDAAAPPRTHPRLRPWAVVAIAAGIVFVLFAPLLLLNPDREHDVAGENEVSLPVRQESEPPPPPTPSNEASSYEMVFMLDDGRQGRLIWDSPTFYEGLVTHRQTLEGPVYDYGFYRTGSDWGLNDPDEVLVPGGPHPDIRKLPEDPGIPWAALINRTSAEATWSWMGGDTAGMSPVSPTHPMGAQAWGDGERRLEINEFGAPVLIERPGQTTFRVSQITHREIRAGEVGNNTDLPFDYALYLATKTTGEQRPVLEDGLVTFADYEAAAARAAGCAGVEIEFSDSSGMFEFPDDPTTSDCVARHVDDIAEVWRVDSQWLEGDEFVILWYTIEGREEYAEMHQVEPGEERALASGDGWAVSIAARGEGYCLYTTADASYGEGCLLSEDLPVPDVLDATVSTSYEDETQLLGASVVGVVTARADRVVIVWDSGEETNLSPGTTVEFGFRGFGMISRGDALGVPIAVHAYAGDTLLGTQYP